jgi:hypothetical protein
MMAPHRWLAESKPENNANTPAPKGSITQVYTKSSLRDLDSEKAPIHATRRSLQGQNSQDRFVSNLHLEATLVTSKP